MLLERHEECPLRRPPAASFRTGLRRRRAFLSDPSLRPAEDGQAEWRRPRIRPRFHGRPRHPAHQRRRISGTTAAEDARVQHRQDRIRQRTLLRHGPRPPLGAHCQGFQCHGFRRCRRRQIRRSGAGRERFLQQGRDRRIHRAVRLRGQSRRAAGHHPRRRFLHLLSTSAPTAFARSPAPWLATAD